MKIYQAYNHKSNAWIKYKIVNGMSQILNVKQKEPEKRFKGIKVKGKRK